MKNLISVRKSIKSFGFALNGLVILVRDQNNARIHIVFATCVIVAGWLLKISQMEWISILVAIGLVVVSEIINSAIENLADFVSADFHPLIKKVKDLSASAVLVSAIIAIIIGIIIFLPKIITLWSVH